MANNSTHYTRTEAETMARHYVIACIWADCPEGTHPRATAEAHKVALARCVRFLDTIGPDMLAEVREAKSRGYGLHPDCGNVAPVFAALGHDLYLTSAGYGVGFWDRDALEPDALGDRLSALCGFGTTFPEPYPDFYRGWLYLQAQNGEV